MTHLAHERTGLAANESGSKAIDIAGDAAIILAQFKRRRDAALRCEPLASGRRDPVYNWERI